MKNLFEELWYGNIAPIDNIESTPEIEGSFLKGTTSWQRY